MTKRVSVVAVVLAALATPAIAGITTFGPSPYLSLNDSPLQFLAFQYFHVEDFEDAELNTPGASVSNGFVTIPGPASDSVDADDGTIDGSGVAGRSWYPNLMTVSFSFSSAALGNLPTHVGIVWTDVGNVPPGAVFGVTDVTVRYFDANDVQLAIVTSPQGDGSVLGGTAEDRFFGAAFEGGISRIEISTSNSTDWEVDHLQYGYIPAPGVAGVALLALAGVTARRRRQSV